MLGGLESWATWESPPAPTRQRLPSATEALERHVRASEGRAQGAPVKGGSVGEARRAPCVSQKVAEGCNERCWCWYLQHLCAETQVCIQIY